MIKSKLAHGIMPASMTIWKSDETYNEKEQEKYLQWLIDNGSNGLSIAGSTGENQAMSHDEQKYIIEHVLSFINGAVPVYPGTGKYSTKETLELSLFAQDKGATGVMILLPFYFNPPKRAALAHFREIRKHLDIDIMIYNNPWFAGYEFNAAEVKELVEDGTISTIKAAHGDVNRIHELKYECGDKLGVFYGHDYAPMEAFFAKADGWLSGLPAVFPKFCRNLFDICTIEKDVDKANDYWYKMMPFVEYFYTYYTKDPHWQEMFKFVLQYQGIDAGIPRRPLTELAAEEKVKLTKILDGMRDLM